jgi:hypothetical protein
VSYNPLSIRFFASSENKGLRTAHLTSENQQISAHDCSLKCKCQRKCTIDSVVGVWRAPGTASVMNRVIAVRRTSRFDFRISSVTRP